MRFKLNISNKMRSAAKAMFLAVLISCFVWTSSASAKLYYGIGTGLAGLNVKGDLGLNLGRFGPVQLEVDLDPSDIADLTNFRE